MDHANILPLLGFTFHAGASFSFISEWMDNGTARDYLKTHPEANVFEMVSYN